MFSFPNGTIFSVGRDGYLTLTYGKPLKVDTNVSPNLNDDGSTNRCVQIAMAHLGVAVPAVQVSHEELDELMKGFEPIAWDRTCGDFINEHRTGSYFVSSYDGGNGTHAWALVDGTAHNITFSTLGRHIRDAWKIR